VSEPLAEPTPPRTTNEPVGPSPELSAKNVRLGIALLVLSLLIAGAAVAISFIYLHYT
jgi:hypothetical protein